MTNLWRSWWYAPVLPGEDSFPSACRQVLVSFIVSLSNHLSRKRPVDTFLDFVTNSSSIVIVFLNELAAALNASPNATAEEAVHTYLEMKPESSLASIMDSKHQEKKLKVVANDILLKYLDNKTYMCAPAQVFLKQVLAKLVLSMTVDSCSKPDFINQWIVYLLEEGEPELMEVIDAGVEGSAVVGSQSAKKQVTVDEQADKPSSSPEAVREHKRKASRNKAEEAMDEAMKEAQRLSQLIAEEEAKKSATEPSAVSSSGDVSETTTQGIMTPSSSQGDVDEAMKSDATRTSPSPNSTREPEDSKKPFTSFDQILPATSPTALSNQEDKLRLKPPPVLTLFKASINIFDDASPGNRTVMRSKPNIDYMIQIEPTSSSFPGWMIVRKYTDFETLHEVLRRISVITGTRFTDSHADLPSWKNNTKSTLRIELERYLNDAVRLQPLAESEGMKRFLDKDGGASRSPGGSKGFGWPTPVAFDQMGKSMMDTLTKAPTQVAGGGKAIFGGVTSILGGKRTSIASNHNASASRSSISLNPGNFLEDSYMGSMGNVGVERQSTDSVRSIPAPLSRTPSLSKRVPAAAQPGHKVEQSVELKTRPGLSTPRTSCQGTTSGELSRPASSAGLAKLDTGLNLPPPPSDIPDDYASPTAVSHQPARISDDMTYSSPATRRTSTSTYPTSGTRSRRTSRSPESLAARTTPAVTPAATKVVKATPPISEQETQVAVELLFAVITELYTLSSAWNIRRTLLNAAKSFLLRPGNPQLEAIRQMIQANVIDTSTSDASIAAHILKIRENSLPTEEELKAWPKEMTAEEKEQLRIKARALLVERGMPAALTSVMGAAASGEALGRVFDCLQVEGVGRGVVFGVLLQALRAIVQ